MSSVQEIEEAIERLDVPAATPVAARFAGAVKDNPRDVAALHNAESLHSASGTIR